MDLEKLGPSKSQKATGGSFDLSKDFESFEGLKQGSDVVRLGP